MKILHHPEDCMKTQPCGNCQTPVRMWFNPHTKREEPVSQYWKGQKMVEVYCSPKCGFEKHERGRKHENTNSATGLGTIDPCVG
jgi:hypothetical protein